MIQPKRLCNLLTVPLVATLLFAPAPLAAAAEPTPEVALKPFSAARSGNGTGMQLAIAAIVNDEVISGYDLDQRVRLVVGASGAQIGSAEMERIRTQMLRALIDEKLKLQEARRVKINVPRQDIVDRLNQIAQQNGTSVDGIQKELKGQGVSMAALTERIEVEIAWETLVQARFLSEVKPDPAEVQRILDEMRANSDKPQYNVVEIFLEVDSPGQDAKVRQAAMDLVDQVRQGAPFSALAANYSQSPSAANGGDIGWVTPGQLPADLDQWVRTARRGEITLKPIRTVSGYYLLGVRDTRNVAAAPSSGDAQLALKRILVRVSANEEDAQKLRRLMAQLNDAAKRINGCDKLPEITASIPGAQLVDLGTKRLRDLAPADANRVADLVTGRAAGPRQRSSEGFDTIVLCGQTEETRPTASNVPTERDVQNQLMEQQLSMLSRRYLRDLRRDAVIDSRVATE